jgi:hypothetical protein
VPPPRHQHNGWPRRRTYLSWRAIALAGVVIALASAVVLQINGLGYVAGIATTAPCLVVNQFAYLVGADLKPIEVHATT